MDNFITGSPQNIGHLIGHPGFRFVEHNVTDYIYTEGPLHGVLHFASPASPVDYLEHPIPTLKVGSLGTHKTLGLAKEIATEGVRVNGVVPAFTATGIHDAFGGSEERARRIVGTIPMGRIGLPEETAEAVMWLLSDKASFVTGTLLDVAGGS